MRRPATPGCHVITLRARSREWPPFHGSLYRDWTRGNNYAVSTALQLQWLETGRGHCKLISLGSRVYLEKGIRRVSGAVVAENLAHETIAWGRRWTREPIDDGHPSRLPRTAETPPLGLLHCQQPSEGCGCLQASQHWH